MLNKQVRILNFDDSVKQQVNLLKKFRPSIIDLAKIGPLARLWSDNATEKAIKAVLSADLKGAVSFLGSGDFHHISSILIEQFSEPITVIVFDAHPDWDILPPKSGCGSWVTKILRLPNIEQVLLFGISSDDINTFNIQTANLLSLKNDRLRIYPYSHAPTRVWLRRIPRNPSLKTVNSIFGSTIFWEGLLNKEPDVFLLEVLSGLRTRKVYISIDKDCLSSEYSMTNWEEGKLDLDMLLSMLKIIKDNCDILGADITGDFSEIDIKGRIKSILSALDHPKDYSAKGAATPLINSINENTNIKILELFLS